MPDEQTKEATEASGGGGSLFLVFAAALVALLAGAGGAYVMLKPDTEAGPAAAAAATEKEANAGEDFRERLFSMDPFVVNVTGDGYSRYLKVRMDLEADSTGVRQELEARLPQVRDAIIVLLSSKRLSDITDFEGKAMLKEDIQLRVSDVLQGGGVKSVLFTEFVVQ